MKEPTIKKIRLLADMAIRAENGEIKVAPKGTVIDGESRIASALDGKHMAAIMLGDGQIEEISAAPAKRKEKPQVKAKAKATPPPTKLAEPPQGAPHDSFPFTTDEWAYNFAAAEKSPQEVSAALVRDFAEDSTVPESIRNGGYLIASRRRNIAMLFNYRADAAAKLKEWASEK